MPSRSLTKYLPTIQLFGKLSCLVFCSLHCQPPTSIYFCLLWTYSNNCMSVAHPWRGIPLLVSRVSLSSLQFFPLLTVGFNLVEVEWCTDWKALRDKLVILAYINQLDVICLRGTQLATTEVDVQLLTSVQTHCELQSTQLSPNFTWMSKTTCRFVSGWDELAACSFIAAV